MDEFKTATIGERLKHWRMQQKISQLDLALECDTSARHISFIETGKAHPTRELVITLADAISIPLSARNNILISAGYAPQYEETGLSSDELQQVRNVLENMVEQNGGNPSLLIDPHWNISYSNRAFTEMCRHLIDDATLLAQQPLNLLRISLHPQGLINRCTEPARFYQTLMSRARRAMTIVDHDPELEQLMLEMEGYNPAKIDEREMALPQLVTSFTFTKNSDDISLSFLTATLGEPLNISLRELQLEICLPANDSSKAFIETLIQ
jgi:transcriptional regulator with XRE-family HTH domain